MKTSKKKPLKAVGGLLVLLLAGIIFFFTYYQVDEVQVMGSNHYSEKQIRKMVLRHPILFLHRFFILSRTQRMFPL
jgi:cell division septal protein FtsQ